MEQTTWKGTVVKPLSEQLSELAARVKTAEDILAAANQKNRAALESQREQLKSSINKAKDQGKTAAARQDQGQSWWDKTRADVDQRFDTLRGKRDEYRAERDLKKAQNRADDAELDAADAVDFAVYMVDQAEYAVVDAVIARADADALEQQQDQR
jgi:chromosome segregation ATPase